MSYVLKYILRYETERTKTDFRIKIYQDGYVGDPIYKKLGGQPVVVAKGNDDRVSGTSLEFAMQSDSNFEYQAFFSENNKKHKVELYYGSSKVWVGYIVSDQYSEPYIAPPYDVSILCTDGLGLLKSELFELTGMVSRMQAIRYMMDKIGMNIGYQVYIDMLEQSMPVEAHYNPLDYLYFNAEIFEGEKCYDVLQRLIPFGCIITQMDAQWLIQQKANCLNLTYGFDYQGNQIFNLKPALIRVLGTIADGGIYPEGNLTMEFTPAWKQVVIKQLYGKKSSILLNSAFTAGTANWTENGATGFFSVINLRSKTFALLKGTQSTLTKYVSQAVEIDSFSSLTFDIEFGAVGYRLSGGIKPLVVDVYFQATLTNTSSLTTYYLTETGWNTNAIAEENRYFKALQVETSLFFDVLKTQNLKSVIARLPESGTLTVKLFVAKYTPVTGDSFSGIAVKSVSIFNTDLASIPDSEETTVNLTENATKSDATIELMPTDLPDYKNASHFFSNGNFVLNSDNQLVPAKLWTGDGLTYLEYLSAFVANQYSVPKIVLKGVLAGANLSLSSIIRHDIYPESKYFYPESGRWNVIEESFELELYEVSEPLNLTPVTFTPPYNPTTEYNSYPDLSDHLSFNETITDQWQTGSEGSYDHFIPETNIPVIVSRKETVTPYQLDYDSGLPQFSVKDSLVVTNVDDVANQVTIEAGQLISHNYAALDRSEIKRIKTEGEEYTPVRTWNIAETDITLGSDAGYFLYVKVPLAEE